MGSLAGEELQLTNDLEASIVGLPPDYRVMVGWDPQLNQDVGWITVKRGVDFHFDSLQVRDFNLNFRGLGVDDGASQEYPSNSPSTDIKPTVMNDKKDVLKNSEKPYEKCQEDQICKLPLYGPKTCLPPSSNVYKDLVTCSYCKRKVAYLPVHEKKCPVKNAKNQKRVDCPLCDFKPTSISSHLRSHFRPKRTCPFCKIVISEKKFDNHLQKCKCNKMDDDQDALTGNDEKINSSVNMSGVSCENKSGDLVGNDNENLDTNITSVDINSNGYFDDDDESREMASILKCTSEVSAGYKKDRNNSEESQCRLNFEFLGDETIKKSIKISMFEPIEKAMKRFCSYKKCVRLFGSKLDDLEFKSNDTLLTGEEYAGSIEDGLIKVTKKSDVGQVCRGGYFEVGDQRSPSNLHHFLQGHKKDLSVFTPSNALPMSPHENFDHDEMEFDNTEVIVKFAQF